MVSAMPPWSQTLTSGDGAETDEKHGMMAVAMGAGEACAGEGSFREGSLEKDTWSEKAPPDHGLRWNSRVTQRKKDKTPSR